MFCLKHYMVSSATQHTTNRVPQPMMYHVTPIHHRATVIAVKTVRCSNAPYHEDVPFANWNNDFTGDPYLVA